MTQTIAALERLGQPLPIPRAELEAAGVIWPPAVRELLETWGAGTLGGRFRVLSPSEARFRELLAFVRDRGAHKHARGWWKICTTAEWTELAVFAEGQRGDVFAFAGRGQSGDVLEFAGEVRRRGEDARRDAAPTGASAVRLVAGGRLFWFGPRGESVAIGRSLDELAAFLASPTIVDLYGEALQPSYLVSGAGEDTATPRDRMLAALRASDNARAESIFQELIGSDDPTTALIGFVRALASDEAIAADLRDDWRGTATQLLKRRLGKERFAQLDLVVERTTGGGASLTTEAEPAWDVDGPRQRRNNAPITIDDLERDWRDAGDPTFDLDGLLVSVMAIPAEHRREVLVAFDAEIDASAATLLKLADCVPLYSLALRRLTGLVIDPLYAAPIDAWRAALRSYLFYPPRSGNFFPSSKTNFGWVWSYVRQPKDVIDVFLSVLAEMPGAQTRELCLQALHNQFHDDRAYAVLRENRDEYSQAFATACVKRNDHAAIPLLWDIARPHGSYDFSVIKALTQLGDERAEKILARLQRHGL